MITAGTSCGIPIGSTKLIFKHIHRSEIFPGSKRESEALTYPVWREKLLRLWLHTHTTGHRYQPIQVACCVTTIPKTTNLATRSDLLVILLKAVIAASAGSKPMTNNVPAASTSCFSPLSIWLIQIRSKKTRCCGRQIRNAKTGQVKPVHKDQRENSRCGM